MTIDKIPRVLGENEARGALLVDLVSRWGMVTCVRGDDTFSGHTCLEPMAPEAVAARAEAMVDLIYKTAHTRGWVIDLQAGNGN